MILTVTPNPALDVTYRVPELLPGTEHRTPAPVVRAGGKGVNVARALRATGREPLVVGPCGGPDGDALAARLADDGLAHRLVPVGGVTRRTVTVVDDRGTATGLYEAGPQLGPAEWAAVADTVRAALPDAGVLVVSGSLPPGVPADAVARLVADAHRAGVPAVVDTSGAALTAAAAAGPALVKPNAAELREATGTDGVVAGARALLRAGARAVLASLGADGMVLVSGPRATPLRCRPPAGLRVINPTGAGDAGVAAAASALDEGLDPPALLRRGVAWSAAAVTAGTAGELDPDTVRALEEAVVSGEEP